MLRLLGTGQHDLLTQETVMKCVCGKSAFVRPALARVAFMILLIPSPLANAQSDTRPRPVRPSPGGLKPPPRTQKPPSIREREFKILEMEREAAKPRTPEEEKLALAQI